MEETQERSLAREPVKPTTNEAPAKYSDLDPELRLAIQCAAEKKAFDIVALDLRPIASFTEFLS